MPTAITMWVAQWQQRLARSLSRAHRSWTRPERAMAQANHTVSAPKTAS